MRTELCDRFGIDVPNFAFSHCRLRSSQPDIPRGVDNSPGDFGLARP